MLHKMQVKNDSNCTYCPLVRDHIEHFFFECGIVKEFWKRIEQEIFIMVQKQVKINTTVALFGLHDNDILTENEMCQINHVILIAKMCISIKKKTESPLNLWYIYEHEKKHRVII